MKIFILIASLFNVFLSQTKEPPCLTLKEFNQDSVKKIYHFLKVYPEENVVITIERDKSFLQTLSSYAYQSKANLYNFSFKKTLVNFLLTGVGMSIVGYVLITLFIYRIYNILAVYEQDTMLYPAFSSYSYQQVRYLPTFNFLKRYNEFFEYYRTLSVFLEKRQIRSFFPYDESKEVLLKDYFTCSTCNIQE